MIVRLRNELAARGRQDEDAEMTLEPDDRIGQPPSEAELAVIPRLN